MKCVEKEESNEMFMLLCLWICNIRDMIANMIAVRLDMTVYYYNFVL